MLHIDIESETLCVLVYEKTLVVNGGFTKIVGPFKSPRDAQRWHADNAPDEGAVIDAISVPKALDA